MTRYGASSQVAKRKFQSVKGVKVEMRQLALLFLLVKRLSGGAGWDAYVDPDVVGIATSKQRLVQITVTFCRIIGCLKKPKVTRTVRRCALAVGWCGALHCTTIARSCIADRPGVIGASPLALLPVVCCVRRVAALVGCGCDCYGAGVGPLRLDSGAEDI